MERPWYAHYDPGVPSHIDYPSLTFPQLFEQTAARYPKRVATMFHGKAIRYGDMQGHIEAFAGSLTAIGVLPGDRVALMLPNVPQYVVAFFGALRAGAIVVPTNPLYTERELEHQLNDAGVTVVVTLDQLFGKVQAALPYTCVRAVILTDVAEALPRYLRPALAFKSRQAGLRPVKPGGIVHRFAPMVRSREHQTTVKLDPEDLAVLQYTGGTTGRSKGAMLTHRNLVANTTQGFHWQGTSDDEAVSILCAAPFFHVYGMTIGMNLAVVAGAAMLLVPRWNPKEVVKITRKYRPALFPGVPTMYLALADVPGVKADAFSSLRACISGAAPLPPEVARRFAAISGAPIVEGYGLTEASPVTHCNPIHGDNRPGTVGVPFPDTDAMITDPETWEPLPLGEIGEMTVRGPQVMMGYWNRPEETAGILRGGWLHTGDMATMDEEGYFCIVDRKKDVIIAGGYNVYPREVEDVLYEHPAIREAAVIGVPSDYRGETVKAFIALREGSRVGADDITAFCRERLAPFKVPKIVEFRDELPKSLIGKVLRRTLREEELPLPLIQQRPVAS